jgi:hypothetical protein
MTIEYKYRQPRLLNLPQIAIAAVFVLNMLPNISNWTEIVENADDFYLRGGSFQANNAFLNRYISTTYKRMELPFVPQEDNRNTSTSTTDSTRTVVWEVLSKESTQTRGLQPTSSRPL